jgi:hypothetical protein
MTPEDLGRLAEQGPQAADLLYERMQELGLTREDVEAAASGVMLDLERTCACCHEKGKCEKDLSERPQDPRWKSYCPNTTTLDALTQFKKHVAQNRAS